MQAIYTVRSAHAETIVDAATTRISVTSEHLAVKDGNRADAAAALQPPGRGLVPHRDIERPFEARVAYSHITTAADYRAGSGFRSLQLELSLRVPSLQATYTALPLQPMICEDHPLTAALIAGASAV